MLLQKNITLGRCQCAPLSVGLEHRRARSDEYHPTLIALEEQGKPVDKDTSAGCGGS